MLNLNASFYCDISKQLNRHNNNVKLSLRVSERGWIKLESNPNVLSWDLGCTNDNVEYYKNLTKELKPFLTSFPKVKYFDTLEVCTCQSKVHNNGKKSCSMCYESLTVPDKEGFIYAISDRKYVKIGVTKRDPYIRLAEMQTGNAETLKVIKYWNINNIYSKEEEIHRILGDKNYRGEWFRFDSNIIGEINNIIYNAK